MDFKDYYKILGVSPDDDEKTIKKAYQKLAKKYHPDVNPGDKEAETKFKEVSEAYQAVSDPEKRRKYDDLKQDYQQWQSHGGRGDFDWDRWQAQPGAGGYQTYTMSQEDFADLFGSAGRSGGFSGGFSGDGFSEFFSTLFGGGGGFGGGPAGAGMNGGAGPGARSGAGFRSGSRAGSGQDAEAEVQVTLEEVYRGTTRLIRSGEKQIQAKIPKGVRTGSKVRLAGQGGPAPAGGSSGNLYLKITVTPDQRFTRDGDDLKVRLPVNFYQALVGGEIRVQTFDSEVMLKIPPLCQSGKTFRLKGKGLPKLENPNQYGDLYAELTIMLPEDLKPQELETLRELAHKRGIN